jgi:hypothetical protein
MCHYLFPLESGHINDGRRRPVDLTLDDLLLLIIATAIVEGRDRRGSDSVGGGMLAPISDWDRRPTDGLGRGLLGLLFLQKVGDTSFEFGEEAGVSYQRTSR